MESMHCYQSGHWTSFPGAKNYAPGARSSTIWSAMEPLFMAVTGAAAEVLGRRYGRGAQTTRFQCSYGSKTFLDDDEIESCYVDGWTEHYRTSIGRSAWPAIYSTTINVA